MLVRRSNELRDAARMSFDCQVCVWFLLKEGNIVAVTGTGYDGNYIQLHWWLPSLQSRTVLMCVAWFPAPADSAACKRRHECVETQFRDQSGDSERLEACGPRNSASSEV